jgi:hypothetical protein
VRLEEFGKLEKNQMTSAEFEIACSTDLKQLPYNLDYFIHEGAMREKGGLTVIGMSCRDRKARMSTPQLPRQIKHAKLANKSADLTIKDTVIKNDIWTFQFKCIIYLVLIANEVWRMHVNVVNVMENYDTT